MTQARSRAARANEVQQLLPVVRIEEDDREVEHLVGLDQRERLEELVERAEAAGEDHEALCGLHEADLARVEVVERDVDVEVRVRVLLVRQLDVEADREAAAFLRAAVRGLHHAGPAPGDHRPTRLREEATGLARGMVSGVVLSNPRGTEERDGGRRDPLHRLEAALELARDLDTLSWRSPSVLSRIRLSSISLKVALDVRCAHRQHEKRREAEVDDRNRDPLALARSCSTPVPRSRRDGATGSRVPCRR